MKKLALSKDPIAMLEELDSDPGILMLEDDEPHDECRPAITVTLSPDFIVAIHAEGQSDAPYYNDLLRMARRMKVSLKNIRYQLTHLNAPLTAEEERCCRMRFFNIRALGLMLERGIPQWQNCRNDEAIVQQCAKHGIIPPLDEWQADWLAFAIYCADTQEQRLKNREDQRRKRSKLDHLISLKDLKLKALLSNINYPSGVSVKGYEDWCYDVRQNGKVTIWGNYEVALCIDELKVLILTDIAWENDTFQPLIEALKRINNLILAFRKALSADMSHYGPLHLCSRYSYDHHIFYRGIDITPPLYISDSKRTDKEVLDRTSISAYRPLNQINGIITELASIRIGERAINI